jgi:hypothetical protein
MFFVPLLISDPYVFPHHLHFALDLPSRPIGNFLKSSHTTEVVFFIFFKGAGDGAAGLGGGLFIITASSSSLYKISKSIGGDSAIILYLRKYKQNY